ncbi:MAG: hypothetical protein HND27_06640 [Bacteroidetes bacterium]|nr:hypothetical protein [Flavobacteriales bacterium]MCL4816479.1 hypothetical protein [Flavobacteriales bacterium]NOG95442.1 hypothetical protein [Bacteroidota bacterium]WKZ74000.1 MAG: tetratricopeptide repeat protein [Vicingaceae bacterium]CAG0972311.1 hypothetical protein FLAV_01307 [Flavobacteriales bacterium]
MTNKVVNILFALLMLASRNVMAQEPEKGSPLDKVIILYVDGKYEDCIFKAEKLSENDKYRKDPTPFIYVAMAYFEISKSEKLQEKYPKAFSESVKWADKGRKKDKTNETVVKYKDFFAALKDSANKLGHHFYLVENYSKALSAYKMALKVDPNDPVLQLWKGLAANKAKNAAEANLGFTEANKQIKPGFEPDMVTAPVLAEGLLFYSEYLQQKGMTSDANNARSLADEYKKYDPEELDKKKKEERLKKEKEKTNIINKKFVSDANDQ